MIKWKRKIRRNSSKYMIQDSQFKKAILPVACKCISEPSEDQLNLAQVRRPIDSLWIIPGFKPLNVAVVCYEATGSDTVLPVLRLFLTFPFLIGRAYLPYICLLQVMHMTHAGPWGLKGRLLQTSHKNPLPSSILWTFLGGYEACCC